MTLIEHLEELRNRIVISLVAYIVGSIAAFVLYEPILEILRTPLDEGGRIGDFVVEDLYVSGITTAFVIRMKVAAFAGLVFALPVVLYQLWRFVTPGLEAREKRYAIPFVLASVGLFALGTWFAFLVMPAAVKFLLGFTAPEQGLKPLILIGEYLSFVMYTILAFAISFEFPLLLVFLGMAGVMSSARLRKARRWALVLIVVVAAVATPSQDPLSQLMLAVPLYILYEGAILVIRFALKK